MTLAVPNPSTAAAGAKQTATTWNKDVRDAVNYLLALQGGVGRRNLLTNSNMDIWQRGTSFAIASSTKTYTADRWVAYRAATGSTVSRQAGPTGQSYGLRYQRDSGNTSVSPMKIIQALTSANSLKLAGQAVSVRLNLQAGANFSAAGSLVTVLLTYGTGTDQSPEATWTGTLDALSTTQAVTTTATDYTFDNIVVPSNATQVKLNVYYTPVGTAGANDWVQLNGAQVTVGSAAGFERLPVETTKAECRDYFRIVDDGDLTIAYNSPASVYAWCRFDPAMRRSPTVTTPTGTWTADMSVSGIKTYTGSLALLTTTPNSVLYGQGGWSGLAVGAVGQMTVVPSPGIFLDAEL